MNSEKKRKYSQCEESISPSSTSIDRDNFCWKCHKKNTNWHCATCVRTFHKACFARTNRNSLNVWQCSECIANSKKLKEMEKDGNGSFSGIRELNRLLTFAYYELISEDSHMNILSKIDSNEWEFIETKMKDEKYRTTLEFVNDFKWIGHRYSSKNKDKSAVFMDDLINQCSLEIKIMEMCSECYDNAHKNQKNYFVNVCKSRHKPVWAKLNGFPYWPAKVMQVKKVRNKVFSCDVQFFGTHEFGESVPFDNIKRYSIKDPNIDLNAKDRKDLDDCMPEWKEYIRNYKPESESVLEDSTASIDLVEDSSNETDPMTSFISYIESLRKENEHLKADLRRTQVERNDSKARVSVLENRLQNMKSSMIELRMTNNKLSSENKEYSEVFKAFEGLIKSLRKNK